MEANPPLAKDLRRVLIDEDTIARRVQELADEINVKYRDSEEPLILVGVLKGSFIFLADLSRRLTIPHIVDFIAISSYGKKGDKRGEVRLLMDTRENLSGHDVLIVEDILDSGSTLSYLIKTFGARNTKSVSTAVFSDTTAARPTPIPESSSAANSNNLYFIIGFWFFFTNWLLFWVTKIEIPLIFCNNLTFSIFFILQCETLIFPSPSNYLHRGEELRNTGHESILNFSSVLRQQYRGETEGLRPEERG